MKWQDLRRAIRWVTNPAGAQPVSLDSDRRRDQIARIYDRAVRGYLPRRFDGPVLCLRAIEEAHHGSVVEWRRLSRELSERLIPGDHDSCIIAHGRSLAAELDDWLR